MVPKGGLAGLHHQPFEKYNKKLSTVKLSTELRYTNAQR